MTLDLLTYAHVAQACYENTSQPTWQDKAGLTHVYERVVNGQPHFNFQGTIDAAEWLNRDFDAIGLETFDHPLFGPVHDGFARGAIPMAQIIYDDLTKSGAKSCSLGGHSKGAGEAQICAAELKRLGFPPSAVYLFEPPRAGTATLKAYLADIPIAATRTFNEYGADVVTEVPMWPWVDVIDLEPLKVPDHYDIATKHKILAVIEALQAQGVHA